MTVNRGGNLPAGRLALTFLLAILTGALVGKWLLHERAEPELAGAAAEMTVAEVASLTPPVAEEFAEGCGNARTAAAAHLDAADFEEACLRHLGEALGAIVLRDTAGASLIDEQYRFFRSPLREVDGTQPGARAGALSITAQAAVELMDRIRTVRFPTAPHLERVIEEARIAADEIDPRSPLAAQRSATARFFRRAGEAVRALEDAAAGGRVGS